jgi:hypothetical protein
MKQKMTPKKITAFWVWFNSISGKLAANVEDKNMLEALDNRVRELHPRLSWEIGPGKTREWQFVISPNLDRDLRKLASTIVAQAPVLPDWQFYAARRPKHWNYQFQLESGDGERVKNLDASNWKFVLLEYPDETHEILLEAWDAPSLGDDERWQAAAIVLESILGEDTLLDRIDDFELVSKLEPQFAESARPIQELREVFLGA